MQLGEMHSVARWLSWLKRLTSNEEIPSSNLGRAFLHFIIINFCWEINAYSSLDRLLNWCNSNASVMFKTRLVIRYRPLDKNLVTNWEYLSVNIFAGCFYQPWNRSEGFHQNSTSFVSSIVIKFCLTCLFW